MIRTLPNFRQLVLLILPLGVLLSGCISGKNRFEQGDYDAATLQAIKRLRNNPNSSKAREVLPLAYKHAKEFHINQINMAKANSDEFRFDHVVAHYEKLNLLYNEIQRCPACKKIVPSAKPYQAELEDSRLTASKAHFNAGLRDLDLNTKLSARDAYQHFLNAKHYTPNFEKIDEYLRTSRMQGTIHVLIDEIPIHSRNLAISNEFFQNKIREFANDLNYTFVQFYRERELNNLSIDPDEVIVMRFDDFVVGQVYFKETIQEVSKDSVKIGTVQVEGEEIPAYGTVNAQVKRFHKSVTSTGLLDVQILNAFSGATLRQQKFPGTYIWEWDWATFNGQKEALSQSDLELIDRNELFPPAPQDLFVAFTQPIFNQVANFIRQHYRQDG
jgi:hypothetical protein